MQSQKMIENVVVKPLKNIINERGGLTEIQRNDDDVFPGFGQTYMTTTLPKIIKGWYRHKNQTDQMVVLSGVMKLVLFDTQENSATHGIINEYIFTMDEPTLVQIPPHVWHAFQSIGDVNLRTLHINSIPHNFDSLDEERIPHDDERIPYQW